MRYTATYLKKIIPFILVPLSYAGLSAQDMTETETTSIETILQSNNLILPIQALNTQRANRTSGVAYIYQIGSDNASKLRISAEDSELSLMQHGNANRADIELKGKGLVHNTVQKGNGNLLLEYGNASHLNLERTIVQDGDNQNLIIYGSNSLTESIQLNVQGDAETITIRNFN